MKQKEICWCVNL